MAVGSRLDRAGRAIAVAVFTTLAAEQARADLVGPGVGGAVAGKADRVVVHKAARRLELLKGGTVLAAFPVALGRNPRGPKRAEGDGRTPEGSYRLDWRNANSRFYRAIHVSYPNAADKALARVAGVSPGRDIMIHGLPNGRGHLGRRHALTDWTEGCIAVTNAQMDRIWNLVDDGTPIDIRP